ncbi:hypothetical protein LHJ74_00685 [Streptomyces sp. N2-109]|uniref:Secreted protein n=1 Tax=Streptomyces gossypii TaxID=2883101 RepID=A0ABT2JMJ2_9ACTN|nr:hypothetical protein [Streptomyces gossypii]MCT2588474.1 hypothetical protein [Streptomyces gossypii]
MPGRTRAAAVPLPRRATPPRLLLAILAAVLCTLFPATMVQSAAAVSSTSPGTTDSASHGPAAYPADPHAGDRRAADPHAEEMCGDLCGTVPRAVRDSSPERHLAHPATPAAFSGRVSYGPVPHRDTRAGTDSLAERLRYAGPRTGRAPPVSAGS